MEGISYTGRVFEIVNVILRKIIEAADPSIQNEIVFIPETGTIELPVEPDAWLLYVKGIERQTSIR